MALISRRLVFLLGPKKHLSTRPVLTYLGEELNLARTIGFMYSSSTRVFGSKVERISVKTIPRKDSTVTSSYFCRSDKVSITLPTVSSDQRRFLMMCRKLLLISFQLLGSVGFANQCPRRKNKAVTRTKRGIQTQDTNRLLPIDDALVTSWKTWLEDLL